LYATGFPVPRPLVLCEDDEIIGTAFFVMEFVEGRIFWDLDLPGLEPAERAAIYDNVNETIARLHNLDYAAIGLEDYGKPGNYFARQISRWSGQYRASETATVEAMDALIEWLPQNIPEDDSASIVHGDYRLDNMIVHPTEPRVIAVLDWELSTIGHPLADFTYHLMIWRMPEIGIGSVGLADKPLHELGIPDEESYIRRYCERTGRDAGIADRNFYLAFNFFRLAAILQGIAGRVRDGTAASAHAAQAVNAVLPLANLGWRFANRG
jgi:aminoglycoside phosphotransferase (APT) family kinase protein